MNLSSLIGFIFAGLVLGLALVGSSSGPSALFNFHALLIVLGGTLAVSCICFPLSRVAGTLKIFVLRILGKGGRDYLYLIHEILLVSQASWKGKKPLELAIQKVRDPFLRDAAELLFWTDSEVTKRDLRQLLETRAETHFVRYMKEADTFRILAKFPPAFGLMGTTLGMIILLRSLGTAGSSQTIGPSMSVALIATLYGIFISNFILLPLAENISEQSKEDLICRRMVIEGILLIAKQKPTVYVEEMVKSFLLPSERGPHSFKWKHKDSDSNPRAA